MGKKAGKIALGLGLLTGAITGLLFAPDEGKNIRNKIAKGDTKGLLDDLESVGEELRQMAQNIAKNPGVHKLMEKGKDAAADAVNLKRNELDTLLLEATKKAEAFKKKVADYVKEQKAILEANSSSKSKKKATNKKGATKKSTGKPTEKPVVKSVDKPVKKAAKKLISKTAGKPTSPKKKK